MSVLMLRADGSCWPNPGAGSFGMVASRDGRVECRSRKDIGPSTNNVAEWRGAIAALDYALVNSRGAAVVLEMDSRLVVE